MALFDIDNPDAPSAIETSVWLSFPSNSKLGLGLKPYGLVTNLMRIAIFVRSFLANLTIVFGRCSLLCV